MAKPLTTDAELVLLRSRGHLLNELVRCNGDADVLHAARRLLGAALREVRASLREEEEVL